MYKKYLLLIILLCVTFLLIHTPLTAQKKIYGARTLTSKGTFTIKVIEKNNNHWPQCISWLVDWLKNNCHGSCSNVRVPIITEYDADCALKKLGFEDRQIQDVKKMDDCRQINFLVNEVMIRNIFKSGFSFNSFNLKAGTTIVINLSGF
jgi:hypothetical protein